MVLCSMRQGDVRHFNAKPYNPTVTENLTTAAGSTMASCSVYTLSNNGSNFTVTVNRGTALQVLLIPSSTIANVVLFPLPTKGEIDSITTKTTSSWSSSGMTTAASTVGDSSGTGRRHTSTAYSLMASVGNTNFQSARSGFTVSGTNAPLLCEIHLRRQQCDSHADIQPKLEYRSRFRHYRLHHLLENTPLISCLLTKRGSRKRARSVSESSDQPIGRKADWRV
jgi:hypothetical protein